MVLNYNNKKKRDSLMIVCPNCNEITKKDVEVYNHGLRKQNIKISPILPTCRLCGAEVTFTNIRGKGEVIILNGTCGSGKSTIAEILQDKGYLAIDGDCAIQSLRHKTGIKQYKWRELVKEILFEANISFLFSEKLVISHVIMPDDMCEYLQKFETRGMKYKFVLLKPEYKAAVERCQTRTCHTSITPEEWIKHFYESLIFDDMVNIIDNTNQTPYETVELVLGLPYKCV